MYVTIQLNEFMREGKILHTRVRGLNDKLQHVMIFVNDRMIKI